MKIIKDRKRASKEPCKNKRLGVVMIQIICILNDHTRYLIQDIFYMLGDIVNGLEKPGANNEARDYGLRQDYKSKKAGGM